MSNQTSAPAICRACQTIDRADGVEDGHLYPVVAKRIRHETAVARKIRTEQNRLTDAITNFAGSMSFVYLHGAWFGVWVLINLGFAGAALAFDRFPFGLLTMIVSLEAIFLSTFVLISQNRVEDRQQAVAEHHYHETGLLEKLLRENTKLTEEIHELVDLKRRDPS